MINNNLKCNNVVFSSKYLYTEIDINLYFTIDTTYLNYNAINICHILFQKKIVIL